MFYVLDLYDYRVRFHFLFSLSCNFLCYSLLTITNLGFFLVTFVPFYINFVLFILFILTGSFCSIHSVLLIEFFLLVLFMSFLHLSLFIFSLYSLLCLSEGWEFTHRFFERICSFFVFVSESVIRWFF